MTDKLDRIRGLSAQIAVLDEQIVQVAAELSMLDHIDDDAQRDAAVTGSYEDRADARMTRADVRRFGRQVETMERDRARLVAKRDRLIRKLAAK